MDLIGEQHYSPMPESMEYYGQNFGLIYYKTTVHGAYGMCSMMLRDLHDRAYVYVDGELKKTFDVMKPDGLIKRIMKKDGLLLNLKNEETELGILVEAMGRVNYGDARRGQVSNLLPREIQGKFPGGELCTAGRVY